MIPVNNPSKLEGFYFTARFDENGRVVVESNAAGVLFFKLAYESYCVACHEIGLHMSEAKYLAPDLKFAFEETAKEG